MFFRFPPDSRWSNERAAVEFGIGIGEYEGVVRIPRRVFQRLLDQAPTPAYHLQRTRLELIAERKLRRRQLVVEVSYAEWTPDGLLRHVVYLGEREDKPPSEVRRDPP